MKSLRAAAVLGLLLMSTSMAFARVQEDDYVCLAFTCDGHTTAGILCGINYNEVQRAIFAYCNAPPA